jgi:hypothetical protein
MRRADIKWVRFLVNQPNGYATTVDFTNIYFTVKKSAKDRNPLFQKSLKNGTIYKLANGDYQFKIDPADTRRLIVPFDYVFDIQIMYKNIIKETFVGTFALKEEITYEENEDDVVVEADYTVPQVSESSSIILECPEYHILQLTTPEPVREGSMDYDSLENKPAINGVTLEGNLSLDELGIKNKALTAEDIDKIIDEADRELNL